MCCTISQNLKKNCATQLIKGFFYWSEKISFSVWQLECCSGRVPKLLLLLTDALELNESWE